MRWDRRDEAVAIPELTNDRELHRTRLGQGVRVTFRLDLVRLGKPAVIVETIKPVLGHRRFTPLNRLLGLFPRAKRNNRG